MNWKFCLFIPLFLLTLLSQIFSFLSCFFRFQQFYFDLSLWSFLSYSLFWDFLPGKVNPLILFAILKCVYLRLTFQVNALVTVNLATWNWGTQSTVHGQSSVPLQSPVSRIFLQNRIKKLYLKARVIKRQILHMKLLSLMLMNYARKIFHLNWRFKCQGIFRNW